MTLYSFLRANKMFKTTNRLPEIGELWIHGQDTGIIYMRIEEEDGEKVVRNHPDDVFYSVDIDSGKIYYTERKETDINVLLLGK